MNYRVMSLLYALGPSTTLAMQPEVRNLHLQNPHAEHLLKGSRNLIIACLIALMEQKWHWVPVVSMLSYPLLCEGVPEVLLDQLAWQQRQSNLIPWREHVSNSVDHEVYLLPLLAAEPSPDIICPPILESIEKNWGWTSGRFHHRDQHLPWLLRTYVKWTSAAQGSIWKQVACYKAYSQNATPAIKALNLLRRIRVRSHILSSPSGKTSIKG